MSLLITQIIFNPIHVKQVDQESAVSTAICYGLDSLWIESWREAIFSVPIQTSPADHLASYTMCTGFLSQK
jgi:hypothetical protein